MGDNHYIANCIWRVAGELFCVRTRDIMSDTLEVNTTVPVELDGTSKSTSPRSTQSGSNSMKAKACGQSVVDAKIAKSGSNSTKTKASVQSVVDAKIAKKNAKEKAEKKAAKVERIKTKASLAELVKWCESFTRVDQMEGRHRYDSDEFGVICCVDAEGDVACPVSVMQFLIDKKQLHSTEGDSATKCFYESEYDLISNFPEHLDRFAAVIQHGAKLARAAKIGDVKAGDYNEDDDSDDDDE